MIRRATMLRSGRRPARVSAKRKRSKLGTKRDSVYQAVDLRSLGICEIDGPPRHAATEHHHVYKPRAAFHQPDFILHVCREHHREFDRPYRYGRRISAGFDTTLQRFRTLVIRAADKWAARALGA